MASRPKPKAADRGRFRLAVYFVNHQSGSGRAYYFHSNRSQDAMGVSANRLKRLVTPKNGTARSTGPDCTRTIT